MLVGQKVHQVGLLVGVGSRMNLQLAACGRLQTTDVTPMFRLCVLDFHMGLQCRRRPEGHRTYLTFKGLEAGVLVQVEP